MYLSIFLSQRLLLIVVLVLVSITGSSTVSWVFNSRLIRSNTDIVNTGPNIKQSNSSVPQFPK